MSYLGTGEKLLDCLLFRPLEEDDFCPHLARLTENLLQYSVEDPGSRDDVGRHLCVLRETTLVWYSLLENKAKIL